MTALSLAQFKSTLRGAKFPRAKFNALRGSLASGAIKAAAEWTPLVRRGPEQVHTNPFPRTISAISSLGLLAEISPEKEFTWCAQLLRVYARKIEDFVLLRASFENTLLQNDISGAASILDTVEARYGISLWLIESRFGVMQLQLGLERQKAYLAKIRETRSRFDVVAFIAFHMSHRAEDITSPERFKATIRAQVAAWPLDEALKSYVTFHLCDDVPDSPGAQARILRYEELSSAIDRYETLIRIAEYCVSETPHSIRPWFAAQLKELAKVIHDHRLQKICFLIDSDSERLAALPVAVHAAADAFVTGDLQSAFDISMACLRSHPENFWNWREVVSCASDLDYDISKLSDTFANKIIKQLYSVSRRQPGYETDLTSLRRTLLVFRSASFSSSIDSTLSFLLSNSMDGDAGADQRAFIASEHLAARAANGMPKGNAFLLDISRRSGASPALVVELFRAGLMTRPEVQILSPSTLLEIDACTAIKERQFETALGFGQTLLAYPQVRISRMGAKITANGLLRLEWLGEAISFVAKQCLLDPGVIPIMPLKQLASLLDKTLRAKLAHCIEVPILLDVYTRHIADDLENIRAYAYEDFLLSKGLKRPSDLAGVHTAFPRHLVIYYLRNVCTVHTMQVSIEFQGTRDLEDERIAICSLLAEIDEKNAKEYEHEARELTRTQTIRGGIRQVEQSKIYVDVNALRRWTAANLTEPYARYRAMIRGGLTGDLQKLLEDALSLLGEGQSLPTAYLELPKDEASSLLADMVLSLLKEYSTNPEHGLDCYLSMRIRHGTLAGQLRHPLEEQNLITQRDSVTRAYASNEAWVGRLGMHAPWNWTSIDSRLREFSAAYDAFVDEIAKELIQLRSDSKPRGLFTMAVSAIELRLLAIELTQSTTFEQFVDLLVQLFWNVVSKSLTTVRKEIDGVLKPRVAVLLADLERDVEALSDGDPVSEFSTAVRRARTDVQQALEHVKDWFQLSKPVEQPDLTLDQLIDISLEMVRSIHRDFNPVIHRTLPDMPPFYNALIVFTDILFIVFDNIRRHSGLNSPSVSIRCADIGPHLRIEVENEIQGELLATGEDRLQRIRDAISDQSFAQGISSEGGTGFLKLRKIVGPKMRLEFGFLDDFRKFRVVFEVRHRLVEVDI